MNYRLRRVKTMRTRLVSQQIAPSEVLLALLAELERLSRIQIYELMKQVG